jgi:glycosyltransferase involved in cell wall biosynthesis
VRVLYVENSAGVMGGSLMSLLQTVRAMVSDNALLPDHRRIEPCFFFLYPNLLLDEFRSLGPVVVERPDYERYGAPFLLPRALDGLLGRVPYTLRRGLGEILPLALRVARVVRGFDADLVHANCRLGSNEYAVLGARLARRPVVVHERLMYRVPRLTRAVAPAADAVVAISRAVADHLTHQRVPVRRLMTIPNGLDAAALGRFIGPPRPEGAPLRVGMVGRITPWKGQHLFVEAARQLAARGANIEFHLAGDAPPRDLPYLQTVRETVLDAGLEDRVFFHGNVKKIYEFMAGMDVLAHCSVDPEPFGRVILEAMALGRPCIATRGGAAEEICTDGVDGLLVEPNRPDQLAAAILRLASDPAGAAALGARARRTVETRFALQTTARRFREIYEGLLTRPEPRPLRHRAVARLLRARARARTLPV